MNTDLTTFHQGTALADPAELDAALDHGVGNRPSVSTGETFIKMDKDGSWVFGSDSTDITDDALWVINTYSLSHGWVKWVDSKKDGEVMVPFTKPLPEVEGAGWDTQVGFAMACIAGEDEGTEVAYYTSSNGGKKAYNAIYDAIKDRPSKDHPLPVVKLDNSSWKSKKYGKVNEPVFEIVDWANTEQEFLNGKSDGKESSEAPQDSEAAEPTKRRRRRG